VKTSVTHATVSMDTVVTIRVVEPDDRPAAWRKAHAASIARAAEWFREIEARCNRFDPSSEVRRLSEYVGTPVEVSAIVRETVRFALALADDTGGAFDPTVGRRMEDRGFDRDYKTGKSVRGSRSAAASNGRVTFRDVELDVDASTITLHRPALLDLGAVAKGFAIDMAARELAEFSDFAIDAGGDLYVAGRNEHGEPWSIGIRHPRRESELIETLRLSDVAACTSGDYERVNEHAGHHIVDPVSGDAASRVASATVIAPIAMVADGLATAAFVLGPARGIELLERHGARGVIVTPNLERFATRESQTLS
jgi:thiamine biosynthesis lipoprotein